MTMTTRVAPPRRLRSLNVSLLLPGAYFGELEWLLARHDVRPGQINAEPMALAHREPLSAEPDK